MRVCRSIVVIAACWSGLGLVRVAQAARVEGLYEAEVSVPSKDAKQRDLALGAALRDVLVKVSGRRDPKSYPGIVQAMSSPGRYVEQYRYRTLAVETLGETELPTGELRLWAHFDESAIGRLVLGAGLPAWGRIRPSVLVWLALESQGERDLVGVDDSATVTRVIRDVAALRGLPLVIPLLDLEDRSRLGAGDVWMAFREKILAASSRYQPDTILTVNAYPQGADLWEARWRLYAGEGFADDWTTRGPLLDAVLEAGMNDAADRLAQRFAGTPGNTAEAAVGLHIAQVRTLADYARVLAYLQSLDGVSRVDVTGAAGDRVSFHLKARGGQPALEQIIALGRTLAPVPGGDAMQYSLLP